MIGSGNHMVDAQDSVKEENNPRIDELEEKKDSLYALITESRMNIEDMLDEIEEINRQIVKIRSEE